MTTKVKYTKCHQDRQKPKHGLLIDVGNPKVPICKASKRFAEKLEDWQDAS